MIFLYLEALAALAVALSILMAGAWMVQRRTGNSGWAGTISTFSLGLVGAGQRAVAGFGHVTGIPPLEAQMLRSRGQRYRHHQTPTSMFVRLPPQKGAIS